VNVVLEDRATYLMLVARHLDMLNDKLKLTDEANPLWALIQELQKEHTMLPIVYDDPELAVPVKPAASPQPKKLHPVQVPQ
jgi:hypothetical protein